MCKMEWYDNGGRGRADDKMTDDSADADEQREVEEGCTVGVELGSRCRGTSQLLAVRLAGEQGKDVLLGTLPSAKWSTIGSRKASRKAVGGCYPGRLREGVAAGVTLSRCCLVIFYALLAQRARLLALQACLSGVIIGDWAVMTDDEQPTSSQPRTGRPTKKQER